MSVNRELGGKARCLKLGMLRVADLITFYFNDTAGKAPNISGRTLTLAGVPELATCPSAGSAACCAVQSLWLALLP